MTGRGLEYRSFGYGVGNNGDWSGSSTLGV